MRTHSTVRKPPGRVAAVPRSRTAREATGEPLEILYHHRIRSKDGQFVHVEEMVNALRLARHHVTVCGPRAVETDAFGAEGRLVPWMKRRLPLAVYELIEIGYSVLAYGRIRRRIAAKKPDVIYERYNLFMLSGVWAKKRFGVPLLLEVNAPLCDERKTHDGLTLERLARWAERYCWTNADAVLPVTRVLAEHVARAGVEPSRIHVTPNAINPERFRPTVTPAEARKQLGLDAGLTIGFIGFVREWHGLADVIDMLSEPAFEDVSLVIVGDGPARASLLARANERGISSRVTFTGTIARDEVARYLAAFDVALQPSVVPYASPLKLYEYMAMGKPVIAPDQPNIREVLEHEENGLLFEPGDTVAFRKCLLRLTADAGLRARLGTAALRHIHSGAISWFSNAAKVAELSRRAVSGRTGAARSFQPLPDHHDVTDLRTTSRQRSTS